MPLKPVNANADPLYELLREGRVKDFNERKKLGEKIDLTHCDFRGLDLRGLDAKGLDLSDRYFRQADLRGIDFSETRLAGASINGAHISGALFSKDLVINYLAFDSLGTIIFQQSVYFCQTKYP